MIYTVTMNPSIDYIVYMDAFVSGMTNRTTGESYEIGGKGVNVSRVLAELELPSTVLGFTAGFTGDAIETELREQSIHAEWIRLDKGVSRINIKMKADRESELNGQGPPVSEQEWERLAAKTDVMGEGDTLVLAGSIPPTVPPDAYERMLARLEGKGVLTVVDATGELLRRCLRYRPFLIKPNRQELSELFGLSLTDERQIASCAGELSGLGARNVLVSLGSDGAILFAEDGLCYRSGVLKEPVIGTVGAGDSMVAGFLAGFIRTGDYAYALRLGTACGNATAFSEGLAKKDKIWELFSQME